MQKLDHFHFKYFCSENNIVWGRFSDTCIIFFLVLNWYALFLRLWAIWLFWNNNNNNIRVHNHKFKGCVSQWYSLNNSIVMKHDYIFWFWILVFLHILSIIFSRNHIYENKSPLRNHWIYNLFSQIQNVKVSRRYFLKEFIALDRITSF